MLNWIVNQMNKMTAAQFVEFIKKDVGYDEGSGNRNKYAAIAGHANGFAWCSTAVSAWLINAGVLPKGHPTLVASSRTMYSTAVKKGWGIKANDIKPGDVCHLKRGPIKAWLGHVGVVVKVVRNSAGKVIEVWSVEGNSTQSGHANKGGAVLLHKRSPTFWASLGYWRPPYATSAVAIPTPIPAPKPVPKPIPNPTRSETDKVLDRLTIQLAALDARVKKLEAK